MLIRNKSQIRSSRNTACSKGFSRHRSISECPAAFGEVFCPLPFSCISCRSTLSPRNTECLAGDHEVEPL
ncbi:hypothetical protein Q7C36_005735 [Tachysurus vachellii]|uniref:Uncharacterized protein n=1 Tax=Tachysurus vachellii TaxID=175792 RepID=A0AA88T0K4_TACVA|nr:hypothetical protein Q7C36_005735 [Tachysurus vachellii]